MEVKEIIKEMFRPVRKNFPRRRIELKSLDDFFEIDIADLTNLKKFNSNYAYILVGVNPFNKRIYAQKLKSRNSKEIVSATNKMLDDVGLNIKHLYTDREFTSKIFKKEVVEARGINHYFSYSRTKAPHSERAIRTLKSVLYPQMALNATKRWVNLLDDALIFINNRKHSRLKIAPMEIDETNEKEIYEKFYQNPRKIGKPRFKINDFVRKAEFKSETFYKSYFPWFSAVPYKIIAVNKKIPICYKLEDYNGDVVPGSFYEPELVKIRKGLEEYFLIERILQRKKDKIKVKFIGVPEPEWVDAKTVKDVKKKLNKSE